MKAAITAKEFRRGGRLVALAAAFIIVLSLAPPFGGHALAAEAAGTPAISDRCGVAQSHLPFIYSHPEIYGSGAVTDCLDAMAEAGIGWVRCTFAWSDMEADEGTWDFAGTDAVIDAAEERGIKILGIMLGSPSWANGGQINCMYPPTDHAAWINYAHTLADRYKGRVAAWEIWNEENIDAFWQPAPDSAAYMVLLEEASEEIRTADPSAKIVMGGMAGLGSDYLDKCLAAGAADYIDAIAYHPYPETMFGTYVPCETLMAADIEWVRSTLIPDHTTKDLEIWLTEVGWTTHTGTGPPEGQSEADQASYLLRTFLNYMGTSVDRVFYYDLWEEIDYATDPWNCYGLLHHDFTPKHSYKYYQRLEEVFGSAVEPSTAPLTFQCTDTSFPLITRAYHPDPSTLAVAAWKTETITYDMTDPLDPIPIISYPPDDTLDITLGSEPHRYLDPVRVDLLTGARTAVTGVTRDASGNITVSDLAVGGIPVFLEFKVAPPELDAVSPVSGKPGETVTLTGDCFGDVQEGGRVYFGSIPATVYASWSDGAIKCAIPSLSPGVFQVRVETAGGASSTLPFTVTPINDPPVLDAISPGNGYPGEVVTLTGDGFGTVRGISQVLFGTTEALLYETWSDGSIRCAVPSLPPGSVRVTVKTAYGTSGFKAFEVERTPGISWCLAEGSTAGGMETWVLVQNPGTSAVSVRLTLQTAEGPLAPALLQNVTIAGGSRTSFRLNDYCETYDVSALVSASGAVVAERATYGPGRAWAHDSVGVARE